VRRGLAILTAALIAATALATAYWLHANTTKLGDYTLTHHGEDVLAPSGDFVSAGYGTEVIARHASWQDPIAVFVAVAGLGVAVVVLPRHRHAT
jgi:hypothetical protein